MFSNVSFSVTQALQVSLLVGELCKTGKLDNLSYTYWDENFTSKVIAPFLGVLSCSNSRRCGVECSSVLAIGYTVVCFKCFVEK